MVSAEYSDTCHRWFCGGCGLFLRDEPDEEVGVGWVLGEEPRDDVYEIQEERTCSSCGTMNENRGERV